MFDTPNPQIKKSYRCQAIYKINQFQQNIKHAIKSPPRTPKSKDHSTSRTISLNQIQKDKNQIFPISSQTVRKHQMKIFKNNQIEQKNVESIDQKQSILNYQRDCSPRMSSQYYKNKTSQLKRGLIQQESPIRKIKQQNNRYFINKSQTNKTNLDVDMTEFKRKPNGTYVRISNKKLFEERTAKKFKQSRIKYGQTLILNPQSIDKLIQKKAQNKKLADIDSEIIFRYFQDFGYLNINTSSKIAFDYFTNLCIKAKRKLNNPHLKKYKNYLYFGQKPDLLQPNSKYEGFIYYYQNKLYFGQFLDNKRHGFGCQISLKEGLIAKGNFKQGVKQDYFYVAKIDEFHYLGQMKNGLFNGKGILTTKFSKYNGQFIDGFKAGFGQQVFFLTGEKYIGNYENGLFQGQGQLSTHNYVYKGTFKNNLKQGEGIEVNCNEQYNGTFKDGKRWGKGVLSFANGDIYRGQFNDGTMNGRGEIIYRNGRRLKGIFINGSLLLSNLKGRKNLELSRMSKYKQQYDLKNSNIQQNGQISFSQKLPQFNRLDYKNESIKLVDDYCLEQDQILKRRRRKRSNI